MDVSEFKSTKTGRVVACPEGYAAFVPAPLPLRLTFTAELAVALSRADAALGVLSGLGSELPSPVELTASFLRQEVLCSSRIEGADVTLTDMLLHEISAVPVGAHRDELDEVRNALATLVYGIECLARGPLDLQLIRGLHARLLHGDLRTEPGEFRTGQNWVGAPGSTIADAVYVPPPVRRMQARLDQLEQFMAERDRLPDLLQCAMAHAQFESIHPFVGGNGRLGRILTVLFLIARGRLSQPLLYLSAYLEAHRHEYYVLLQRLRTHGDWLPWLLFFLAGVRETAEHAAEQVRALKRQHARYRSESGEKLHQLADELFVSPFTSVPHLRRSLRVNDAKARRVVARLEGMGLLAPVPGSVRPRLWVAPAVLEAIRRPIESLVGALDESPQGEPQKSRFGWDTHPRRTADRLLHDAMAMIDVARDAGVVVRLAGGLAVRRHCIDLEFLEREYSDIDLVGLAGQHEQLTEVLESLGYVQNFFVSHATQGAQLQFVRRESGKDPEPEGAADLSDGRLTSDPPLAHHVDVFLDVMRMDHDLDMRERLEFDEYAISPVDALIAKAQIGKINQKDIHDIIALFKDLPVRETDDGLSIYAPYIAAVCADDWGLCTDVTTNLHVVLDWLGDYSLTEDEKTRVRERIAAVLEAIERAEKTRRWKLRARIGKRAAWRREIEDTEGTPVIIQPG